MRKQILSFTIEPELEQYLRRMADKAHMTVSQYLRNLIWDGYDTEQIVNEEKNTHTDTSVHGVIKEQKECKTLDDVDLEHIF